MGYQRGTSGFEAIPEDRRGAAREAGRGEERPHAAVAAPLPAPRSPGSQRVPGPTCGCWGQCQDRHRSAVCSPPGGPGLISGSRRLTEQLSVLSPRRCCQRRPTTCLGDLSSEGRGLVFSCLGILNQTQFLCQLKDYSEVPFLVVSVV